MIFVIIKCNFCYNSIQQITKWLNEEGEDYISYQDYGDSSPSTQVLLDEHYKFEEVAKVHVRIVVDSLANLSLAFHN